MSDGGHVDDGDGGGGLELMVSFCRFLYGNIIIIVGFLGTVFISSGPREVTMADRVVPVNPFEVC